MFSKHHRYISVLCVLVLATLVGIVSCGGSTAADEAKAAAQHCITLFEQGKTDSLAGLTAACRDASPAYRQHYQVIYGEMLRTVRSQYGKLLRVDSVRVEPAEPVDQADAYLHLTFQDGKTTDILLQLVRKDGEWLLK